jgi:acetyl-CoA synthetase
MAVESPAVIRKHPEDAPLLPNMPDLEAARRTFTWDAARAELDGLPGGGLNIAHEAVDRHAAGPHASRVALRFLDRDGARRDLTYRDLAAESSRFAHVLAGLGVTPGERVFTMCERSPSLFAAVLGTLKRRAVVCPLFPAFGPGPATQRLALGDACVLVTTSDAYARKIAPGRADLPELRHVLLVDAPADGAPDGTQDLHELMAAAPATWEIPATAPDDPALLHFTSGTTGRPKGAVHVHEAVVAHHATARLVLDLHEDDVFWCTADPGWVTGTSYGIIAPLTAGVTSVVDGGGFDAARWYRLLDEEGVSVWYTSPTALRMLMRAGDDLAREHDLSRLRFVLSVGEPLNPQVVVWGQQVLGRPVHDTWWQTETGGIMIANVASADIRPGSMGRPLPGVEAAVARRDADGQLVLGPDGLPDLLPHDEEGELVLHVGWPSMFRAYLHEPERYRAAFAGPWYLTGDLVRRDADGCFWFVGRGDDIIKTSGHLVGPFEVESVLMDHPAVAEAGVVGVPDPLAGQRIKAFVLLAQGSTPSPALRREILAHARRRLGPAVAPRELEFRAALPHTSSGKIMRRLLRAEELGLPQGDVSTLEPAP